MDPVLSLCTCYFVLPSNVTETTRHLLYNIGYGEILLAVKFLSGTIHKHVHFFETGLKARTHTVCILSYMYCILGLRRTERAVCTALHALTIVVCEYAEGGPLADPGSSFGPLVVFGGEQIQAHGASNRSAVMRKILPSYFYESFLRMPSSPPQLHLPVLSL